MGEVAKMLNTYHSGHYRVYNLCSEKTYGPGKFAGGEVVSYPMDDHEVPTLPMLFAFVRCAVEALHALCPRSAHDNPALCEHDVGSLLLHLRPGALAFMACVLCLIRVFSSSVIELARLSGANAQQKH